METNIHVIAMYVFYIEYKKDNCSSSLTLCYYRYVRLEPCIEEKFYFYAM